MQYKIIHSGIVDKSIVYRSDIFVRSGLAYSIKTLTNAAIVPNTNNTYTNSIECRLWCSDWMRVKSIKMGAGNKWPAPSDLQYKDFGGKPRTMTDETVFLVFPRRHTMMTCYRKYPESSVYVLQYTRIIYKQLFL